MAPARPPLVLSLPEVAILICSHLSVFCHISKICYQALAIRYGSPTIDDIEAYTIALRTKLDDAESAGRIPKNISLEVCPSRTILRAS